MFNHLQIVYDHSMDEIQARFDLPCPEFIGKLTEIAHSQANYSAPFASFDGEDDSWMWATLELEGMTYHVDASVDTNMVRVGMTPRFDHEEFVEILDPDAYWIDLLPMFRLLKSLH